MAENTPRRYLYIRKHSTAIRQSRKRWLEKDINMVEDRVVEFTNDLMRAVMTIICRNRCRLLMQAWEKWTTNTNVVHDYKEDLLKILSRPLQPDELRTEFEIEVMFKWAAQNAYKDPTGLAHLLGYCKSRKAVIMALQQLRLERISPGDGIVYQGSMPRPEDGLFTIIKGECEVVQFSDGSVPMLDLASHIINKNWDEAALLLSRADVIATYPCDSGFGETASLNNIKRGSSIRAAADLTSPVELLVLPKASLQAVVDSRGGSSAESHVSGAIDFLRLCGLGNKCQPSDLYLAARHLKRRVYNKGNIIYFKGDPVKSVYLVVNGDFLLDIEDITPKRKEHPFVYSSAESCYHLSIGSIMGDEGLTGQLSVYESTCVTLTDYSVVYEATEGPGFEFLKQKLGITLYSAMVYKDQSRWSLPLAVAEQTNLYNTLNSLRQSIAYSNRNRGAAPISYVTDDVVREKASPDATGRILPVSGFLRPSSKAKQKEVIRYTYDSRGHKKTIKGHLHNVPPDSAGTQGQGLGQGQGQASSKAGLGRGQDSRMSGKGSSTNSNSGVVGQLPYSGMHNAMEILKIAKKRAEQQSKMLARENLLMNAIMERHAENLDTEDATAIEHRKLEDRLNYLLSQNKHVFEQKWVIKNDDEFNLKLGSVVNIQESLMKMIQINTCGDFDGDGDDEDNDDDDDDEDIEKLGDLYGGLASGAVTPGRPVQNLRFPTEFQKMTRLDDYYKVLKLFRTRERRGIQLKDNQSKRASSPKLPGMDGSPPQSPPSSSAPLSLALPSSLAQSGKARSFAGFDTDGANLRTFGGPITGMASFRGLPPSTMSNTPPQKPSTPVSTKDNKEFTATLDRSGRHQSLPPISPLSPASPQAKSTRDRMKSEPKAPHHHIDQDLGSIASSVSLDSVSSEGTADSNAAGAAGAAASGGGGDGGNKVFDGSSVPKKSFAVTDWNSFASKASSRSAEHANLADLKNMPPRSRASSIMPTARSKNSIASNLYHISTRMTGRVSERDHHLPSERSTSPLPLRSSSKVGAGIVYRPGLNQSQKKKPRLLVISLFGNMMEKKANLSRELRRSGAAQNHRRVFNPHALATEDEDGEEPVLEIRDSEEPHDFIQNLKRVEFPMRCKHLPHVDHSSTRFLKVNSASTADTGNLGSPKFQSYIKTITANLPATIGSPDRRSTLMTSLGVTAPDKLHSPTKDCRPEDTQRTDSSKHPEGAGAAEKKHSLSQSQSKDISQEDLVLLALESEDDGNSTLPSGRTEGTLPSGRTEDTVDTTGTGASEGSAPASAREVSPSAADGEKQDGTDVGAEHISHGEGHERHSLEHATGHGQVSGEGLHAESFHTSRGATETGKSLKVSFAAHTDSESYTQRTDYTTDTDQNDANTTTDGEDEGNDNEDDEGTEDGYGNSEKRAKAKEKAKAAAAAAARNPFAEAVKERERRRHRPSSALKQFKEFMKSNVSHAAYIHGRQRGAATSRFRLPQPAPQVDSTTDPETFKYKNMALLAIHNSVGGGHKSLSQSGRAELIEPWPDSKPQKTTKLITVGPLKEKKMVLGTSAVLLESETFNKEIDRRINDFLEREWHEKEALRVGRASMAAPGSRTGGSSRSAGNIDETLIAELVDWQHFSVSEVVERKNGPSVSLPVLGSYKRKGPSSEVPKTLKCHRLLTRHQGTAEYAKITGPPSYVEIIKREKLV